MGGVAVRSVTINLYNVPERTLSEFLTRKRGGAALLAAVVGASCIWYCVQKKYIYK